MSVRSSIKKIKVSSFFKISTRRKVSGKSSSLSLYCRSFGLLLFLPALTVDPACRTGYTEDTFVFPEGTTKYSNTQNAESCVKSFLCKNIEKQTFSGCSYYCYKYAVYFYLEIPLECFSIALWWTVFCPGLTVAFQLLVQCWFFSSAVGLSSQIWKPDCN